MDAVHATVLLPGDDEMRRHDLFSNLICALTLLTCGACAGDDPALPNESEPEQTEDNPHWGIPDLPSDDSGPASGGTTVTGSGNVISGVPAGSVAGDVVSAEGEVRDEQRQVAPFTRVVNASALPVAVAQGELEVSVHIQENLFSHVETTVQGDTLYVRIHGNLNFPQGIASPSVRVTLPALASATAQGAGELAVTTRASERPLTLHAASTGRVLFEGEASTLTVRSDATGAVRLSGSAQRLELTSLKNGSIDAALLSAETGSISAAGNAKVAALVRGEVDVDCVGNANVSIAGGATPRTVTHSGNGKVTFR